MPTPLLLEAIFSLSPAARASLLATFGAPPSRGARAPDAGALARAAFERRTPGKLTRALAFVARFSTPRARAAFIEAANATRDPRAAAWRAMAPADVAAALAIERATSKGSARRAAVRLADLALLRVERELSERPTYDLFTSKPLARDTSVARDVSRALGDVVLDAWTHADADGALRLALFTRTPATTRLLFDSTGKPSAKLEGEGFAIDTLTISPDGARVSITTASPDLFARYVEALSLSLRPSVTLKKLQTLDAASLARVKLPRGVRGIGLVGTRRRMPDGARREDRAPDVLASPHLSALAGGGYIDRATYRVGLEARSADAFIQLPHRVDVSDPEHAAEVRGAIAALGTFEPGSVPDDARSLFPLEHPDWRWRGVIGDGPYAALVKKKRFTRVEVAHVATEDARMHGTSYVVRPIPSDPTCEYALAEDRAYGARIVTPDERCAWRLDLEALAAAMRSDLGAARVDGAGAIAIEGVLDLGVVTLPSGKLRFVYALAKPPKGWLATVRRAAGMGVTLVVLVPRGCAEGLDGVVVIELDVEEQLGAKRAYRALGRAAEALGVAHEIEPWRMCDEDIVVHAPTQRAWLRGVLAALTDSPYRVLELLARTPRVVPTKELGSLVSTSGYPEETARRLKATLEGQVSASLKRAGDDWDVSQLVVTEGKKGYRLGVSARVIG